MHYAVRLTNIACRNMCQYAMAVHSTAHRRVILATQNDLRCHVHRRADMRLSRRTVSMLQSTKRECDEPDAVCYQDSKASLHMEATVACNKFSFILHRKLLSFE